MRANVTPSNLQKDVKNNKPFLFNDFRNGIIQDSSPATIRKAIADGHDIDVKMTGIRGRLGNVFYGNLPASDTPTFGAYKVGNLVKADGLVFSPGDVGKWINFGGVYDFINTYVAGDTVQVEDDTYQWSRTAQLYGPVSIFWHRTQAKWVLQLGAEFWAASVAMNDWFNIPVISAETPFETKSGFAAYKNYAVFFNGNGMFKMDLSATFPFAFKVNTEPGTKTVADNVVSEAGNTYRYLISLSRLQEQGIIDRQTPSVIEQETGLTVAGDNGIDYSIIQGSNEISPLNPLTITGLQMPLTRNSVVGVRQQHFTHYSIWRTQNLQAVNVGDVTRSTYNDPNAYVWVADVRIAGAFLGDVTGNGDGTTGAITLSQGSFLPEDVGSIVTTEAGNSYNITAVDKYGNATIGIVTAGTTVAFEFGIGIVIGGGRVIRGSINGTSFIPTFGSFTTADKWKTLTDSSGNRFIILNVDDLGTATLHTTGSSVEQGFTIDPTGRNFSDTIDDTTLQARQDSYTAYGRFMRAFPNCNVGAIVPGFVVAAQRRQGRLYYSQMTDTSDYLIGQYIPIQYTDQTQDGITALEVMGGTLAVFCTQSTWYITLGTSSLQTLPGSGQQVAMLSLTLADHHIGCMDYGSIKQIQGGIVALITNEPGGEGMRLFSGYTYVSDSNGNLLDYLNDSTYGSRVGRLLNKTQRFSESIYDGNVGWVIWRKSA